MWQAVCCRAVGGGPVECALTVRIAWPAPRALVLVVMRVMRTLVLRLFVVLV